MLDLVPFAGARREMADGDGQTRFVGQLLQFQLPEPQPRAVAAAAVGRDEQVAALWDTSLRPSARHQPRMEATANAPVSWSVPTLTKPALRPMS